MSIKKESLKDVPLAYEEQIDQLEILVQALPELQNDLDVLDCLIRIIDVSSKASRIFISRQLKGDLK